MLASKLFYDYHKELTQLEARLLLTYDKEARKKLYERKSFINERLKDIKIFRNKSNLNMEEKCKEIV